MKTIALFNKYFSLAEMADDYNNNTVGLEMDYKGKKIYIARIIQIIHLPVNPVDGPSYIEAIFICEYGTERAVTNYIPDEDIDSVLSFIEKTGN